MSLRSRSAVVTGSTSGIGLGIARALARSGANVMLNGLGDLAEIERTRAALEVETAVNVKFHGADVSQGAEVDALMAAAESAFGGVDIVVNNAGIQFVSPVEDFPPERWDQLQAIILDSSFRTIRAALPGMKRRNWGRIINLVSVHGIVASPFKSAYVAAKHGQIGLTKSVALEVAETGITCNAVCPGYVRTAIVENQIDGLARVHQLPREQVIRDVVLATQPSKRFVEVDDIAAFVVFLCSDAAKSITGAALPIDGGWTAR